jgi:putative transposase
LFLRVLDSYRGKGYLLHEYVLMPEHFHMLITPRASLEKAIQLVKGGFSFLAKKEIGSSMEIWQPGFSDICRNPVGRKLVERAEEYAYCSSFPGSVKDEVPQWLKPLVTADNGAAKAAPLQSTAAVFVQGTAARSVPGNRAMPVQDIKAVPVQSSEIAVDQPSIYLGDHDSREEATGNLQLQTLGSKS